MNVNRFLIMAPIILGPGQGPILKMKVKFPCTCHEGTWWSDNTAPYS
jgi:hypothetical protein